MRFTISACVDSDSLHFERLSLSQRVSPAAKPTGVNANLAGPARVTTGTQQMVGPVTLSGALRRQD